MTRKNTLEDAIRDYGSGRIGRRDFLSWAGALGVSAVSAGSLLASVRPVWAQSPQAGGTFVEGYDRDLSPLDPIRTSWADPGMNAVYEPLVVRNHDGMVVPHLAESFSSGDTEWRFVIPSGRTFHSGTPVTPQGIADAINAMRTPGEGQNPPFYAAVTDVTADGNEVVISLSRPKEGLGQVLATEFAYIPNMGRRAEVGIGAFGAQAADGTGPFTLAQFLPGQRVRVERWDGYDGDGAPFFENRGPAHLDAVEWVPILEPSQRAPEIETGSVHAIKNPAPADVARLMRNPDLVTIEFPEISNFFLSPNAAKTEFGFDDVRVRQALSHAIDRDGIVAALLAGRAEATRGPASSGWRYYEPGVEAYNAYDPAQSAALLDEAGWTPGPGGVRVKDGNRLAFTAINISDPLENQVMAAISGMFEEIGVSMTVESIEGAAVRERRPTADMFAHKWLWSVPGDVIPLFVRNFQPNDHPDAAEVLAASEEWDSALSEEALSAAASRMQLAVASRAVILPVFTPLTVWVHHRRVHGWRPNSHNLYPFYNDVWLEG